MAAAMSLRILHTADWQLGKPFANVPGDAGAMLREARFEAVRRLAETAREHRVEAVLVAGDVFDSNLVANDTLLRASAAMRAFTGPWLLLPGNHDPALAAGAWSRLASLGLPENVTVVTEARPIPLADGRLVVLPAPLTERRTAEDVTAWMDEAATPAGAVRVGLAHGCVAGRLPDAADAENPIAPDRAERARLDYLALGDWHGTLEIAPRTWYAGTPEPDRHKANDAGHALLVELAGPGLPPVVTRLRTARFTWHSLALDCTPCEGGPAEAADRLLAELPEPMSAVVRFELTGLVDLACREALERVVERRRAEFRHLELVDDGLAAEPSPDDLLAVGARPVVGRVAQSLLARGQAATTEEQATARLALRILWQELARQESRA